MAWTAPVTMVAGTTFTAAHWNTGIRDNLNATAVGLATTAGRIFTTTGLNSITERNPSVSFIGTSETTTSASFTNLATVGPSISIATSGTALAIVGASIANNTAGSGGNAGIDVGGVSSEPVSTTRCLTIQGLNASDTYQGVFAHLYTTLSSAGSSVFLVQYRRSISGTATFSNRLVVVIPF